MPMGMIRAVFWISGIYDGLLGLAFLLAPAQLFRMTGVTPPNHYGYVQFPALLLILFGAMFVSIAADPVKRREQILYGMGLKASYAGVVFAYQMNGGIPWLWIPWAWLDLAFLVLFLLAWRMVGRMPASGTQS